MFLTGVFQAIDLGKVLPARLCIPGFSPLSWKRVKTGMWKQIQYPGAPPDRQVVSAPKGGGWRPGKAVREGPDVS